VIDELAGLLHFMGRCLAENLQYHWWHDLCGDAPDPFLHAWIRFPVLQGKICLIAQYEAVLDKIMSANERKLFRDDVVLHIKYIFSWSVARTSWQPWSEQGIGRASVHVYL
jgi:hypothetical protein